MPPTIPTSREVICVRTSAQTGNVTRHPVTLEMRRAALRFVTLAAPIPLANPSPPLAGG